MVIGMAFGRERLEDGVMSREYVEAHYYADELWGTFMKKFGTTRCSTLLKKRLNPDCDLRKRQALRRLISAGIFECCPEVVKSVAEMAVEIILTNRNSETCQVTPPMKQ